MVLFFGKAFQFILFLTALNGIKLFANNLHACAFIIYPISTDNVKI